MFEKPFSFEGRIRRTEYGISIIIFILIAAFIILMVDAVTQGRSNPAGALGLLILPMIWFMLAQTAKRSHDTNNSGFMMFVPFWSLILLFMEGTRGPNYYGQDPKAAQQQQYLQQNGQQNGQGYKQNNNPPPSTNSKGGYSGGYQGGHNNQGDNNNYNNQNNNYPPNNQQQYYENPPKQSSGDEYKGGDLYK